MYDVAVIGGGVTGGMIARKLSEYNLKTVILEKENDVVTGATKANSAIVHAGFDAKEGSLKAKLNVKGSEMMEKVASELGVKYKRNGSLVVGYNDEDIKTLNELLERGKKNGVKDLKILSAAEVKEIEPAISDAVVAALYAPTGAIICPYELAIAAIGNAMDNGVELKRNFEVKAIIEKDYHYEIKSDKETVEAEYVVNAAGLYADEVAKLAGKGDFKIHPRRGEYMLLDKECGNLVSHTIFVTPSKLGKGILVSPTVDGNLLLGPTAVEMVDKEDKQTHSEGFQSITEQAKNMVENIPFNKVITSFCGLRSVGDTGDFIIDEKNNFVNVAGIESPGLSASPAIAEYVFDLLKEAGLRCEKKSDFNPYRKPAHAFREMSMEEKNEYIKENPKYGRIICRCETVTEGEIIEAIRTNPGATDVDGVKRRTRSGMGRCQGGFCSTYVVELLSEELGISYLDVTKSGGKSYLNVEKIK